MAAGGSTVSRRWVNVSLVGLIVWIVSSMPGATLDLDDRFAGRGAKAATRPSGA